MIKTCIHITACLKWTMIKWLTTIKKSPHVPLRLKRRFSKIYFFKFVWLKGAYQFPSEQNIELCALKNWTGDPRFYKKISEEKNRDSQNQWPNRNRTQDALMISSRSYDRGVCRLSGFRETHTSGPSTVTTLIRKHTGACDVLKASRGPGHILSVFYWATFVFGLKGSYS